MAQVDNALFLYRNLADADNASVAASSQVTGAEATFAQTIDPGEPWRATGKVSETLTYDHGTAVDMTHAACVWHNLDTGGTIRFQAGNDPSFATTIVDTGDEDAWDPVAGLGYDAFGASLGGYPLLTVFNAYVPLKYFDLGGLVTARYSRFTFKNPLNTLITGVALGYGFVGLGKQFQYNIGFNWELKWVDRSDFIETESSVRIKSLPKHRELTLPMPSITPGEATSAWDDIKRAVAQSKPIIAVPFPNAGSPQRYRTMVYGIPQDKSSTKRPNVVFHSSTLMIRELAA